MCNWALRRWRVYIFQQQIVDLYSAEDLGLSAKVQYSLPLPMKAMIPLHFLLFTTSVDLFIKWRGENGGVGEGESNWTPFFQTKLRSWWAPWFFGSDLPILLTLKSDHISFFILIYRHLPQRIWQLLFVTVVSENKTIVIELFNTGCL